MTNITADPVDPATLPRRLNLGCGWDKHDGYLNVDLHAFHEPDLIADIRDLAMLPSGHFDEIVAQDVLEHLTRADAPVALAEWARLLQTGGRLHVRVPNLLGLLALMEQADSIERLEELVQCLFGTQAYNGDFHMNGYTDHLLRHALYDAGFAVREMAPRDEWLFDVVAERVDDPPLPPAPVPQALVVAVPAPPLALGADAASAALADVLARARAVEDPEPSLDATRLKLPKRAVLRLGRVVTARQAQYNRAMREAVEILASGASQRPGS